MLHCKINKFLMMKVTILTYTLCLRLSLFFSQKMKAQKPLAYSFFVGTYTHGESRGIYQFSLGGDGKLITHFFGQNRL